MRYTYRYTKAEKAQKATLEAIVASPTATSGAVLKAIRALERLQAAAERRQEFNFVPPTPPAEPTVDQLVSALETALPTPETAVIEVSDPKMAEVLAFADGRLPKPSILEPLEKCWMCDKAGQPTWDNRILCTVHFSAEAARHAAEAALESRARFEAARNPPDVLTGQGEMANTYDLGSMFQSNGRLSSDFEKSVEIWHEQERQAADRREREAQERADLEAQLNRQRAEYISRHGQLAPHDSF